MRETALERFLRYAGMDTTSDETSNASPSSAGQWNLAQAVRADLESIGAQDVHVDENSYVYGRLPANAAGQPVIALIAHLDTADAVPGRVFAPAVRRFEGGRLPLNETLGLALDEKDFPALKGFIGQELVVTDGTTVLGADDKAGIVEILRVFEILADRPDIPHGEVWAVFTPDEEIGSGAAKLQLERIRADFAYTVDGGALNEIEYENFNAAAARVTIRGRNAHPGYAKGKMINAAKLAMKYHALLPEAMCPEQTEGYEGFLHLRKISGTEESAVLDYIIRDHDAALFEKKKELMRKAADDLNLREGERTASVEITESYRNMKEVIARVPHVLERAVRAVRACGMEPAFVPIRGGTDGARLSFAGLPCPNLGTGGMNWHSVYEFLPVEALEKMAEVLVEVVRA